jgi:hypothetical protein
VRAPPTSTKNNLTYRLRQHARSLEEAVDCACGLYLGDPTGWLPDASTS